MKSLPQFSVVIPLYNKGESIQRTLATVIDQHYAAAEIIVVDDGSTDDSVDKVNALNNTNIRLVRQQNQGVSAARNNGVKLARYPYIAFLDGDDLWSPFYLEKMKSLILRFPNSKFFAANYQKMVSEDTFVNPKMAIQHIPPNGGLLQNYFHIVSHGDLPFMTSSSIILRGLFDEIGGFPLNESMGEDQALFAESALKTDIAYSPLILLSYRTDSENRACNTHLPEAPLPFAQRLLSQAETLPTELHKDIHRYCAAHICHLAKQHLRNGYAAKASELLSHRTSRKKPLNWLFLSLWSLVSKIRQSTDLNLKHLSI